MGGALHHRRTARRRRPPLAAHAAADDRRGHRRDRRGPHHLAARGLRRRAQLGLPLLLAARRRAHPRLPGPRPATPRRPTLWRDWLLRAIAGDPADLQIMYAVDGSRRLPEVTLDHLPGYADSRPVRIGNGAVDQRQNDVLGEVMIALDEARRAEGMPTTTTPGRCSAPWSPRSRAAGRSRTTGCGRSAASRGIHALPGHGLGRPSTGRSARWRTTASTGRSRSGGRCATRSATRCSSKGYDAERGTFVQHYGTTEVDASLLVLPLVGFLDGDDPRMLGTIKADRGGPAARRAVLRYRTETGVDGLAGDEHPFLACSFWLVSAYAAAGRRRRRARAVRPAGRAAQRRRAALGGVRPGRRPDGRQLPAGVQPPRAGAGGVLPRRGRRASRSRVAGYLRRARSHVSPWEVLSARR